MERFEVPNLEDPLGPPILTRWRVIQTPMFGIYLHRLGTSDQRTLHDHPWNFISFVLRGRYDELVDYHNTPESTRHIRWVNVKRAVGTHYISQLFRTPTWTLMFVGRRQREWGFTYPDGTWIPHSEFKSYEY